MKKITLLLADDHPVVRSGLRALLATAPDLEVIGEASDGWKAVRAARQLQPRVVLMDLAMPRLNGVEATRQILRATPLVRVLILSTYSDDLRIQSALAAGAAGYLLKSTSGEVLLEAIRSIDQGASFFSPEILQHLSNEWAQRELNGAPPRPMLPTLSRRQGETLQLIAEGFSTKEMAALMGISHKTVEKHRQALMDKLDIYETAALTRYAVSAGVIELSTNPLPASNFTTLVRRRPQRL